MIAIVLFGFLATAAAAPRYHHHPPPYIPDFHQPSFENQHFGTEMFDTRRFWADLANEMRQLDTMLADFYQKFPSCVSQQGIEGKEYVITITLTGFDEKDIVVKAREGVLMVQAVHKMEGGGEKSYLDIKTLPTGINVNGSWTYNHGVLRIVFPLKDQASTEIVPATTDHTESPVETSREQIEPFDSENKDADADIVRGDQQTELETNEISRNSVEATTYAVDLKDEVEFVPVRY